MGDCFETACRDAPRAPDSEKKFSFDYSYNSFVERDDPIYASQDIVWADIGEGVLANAYAGEAGAGSGAVPHGRPQDRQK